jgi:hypothetical protein
MSLRARRVPLLLALILATGCAAKSASTSVGTADRIQQLEATIVAQADSLAKLRAAAGTSQRRVEELEREIARITQLLTTGTERGGSSDRP